MNFTNGDGLDLTYYDIDLFGGPRKKTDHLINDEKINIDWCYFLYQIILCFIFTYDFLLLFTLCLVFLVISEIHVLFGFKMNEDDVYIADCATTHTILRNKRYFLELTLIKANVSTISGTTNLVEGSGRANITLPNGTRFHINDALYSSKSRRNLLSFKDIRRNGYHIETMNEDNVEYLYITSIISGQKLIMEKLSAFSSRLYHTTIKPIESYVVMNQKFNDPKVFVLWHDKLGHPWSSMMHRIIEHSHGHPLKNQKILCLINTHVLPIHKVNR